MISCIYNQASTCVWWAILSCFDSSLLATQASQEGSCEWASLRQSTGNCDFTHAKFTPELIMQWCVALRHHGGHQTNRKFIWTPTKGRRKKRRHVKNLFSIKKKHNHGGKKKKNTFLLYFPHPFLSHLSLYIRLNSHALFSPLLLPFSPLLGVRLRNTKTHLPIFFCRRAGWRNSKSPYELVIEQLQHVQRPINDDKSECTSDSPSSSCLIVVDTYGMWWFVSSSSSLIIWFSS